MLSPKTKRNFFRIIPFGIIWLMFSIVYTLLERGILGHLNYYPSTGNPYSFRIAIFLTPIFAFVTGLSLGMLEMLYINKWFRRMSFGKRVLYKAAINLAIIVLFLVTATAVANYLDLNARLFSKQVWDRVWAFFFSYTFLSVILYIASIILVSQFYAEVSESIGLGRSSKFFYG